MSRTFRVNFGRKTVRPFEAHDINNMLVLCKRQEIKQKWITMKNKGIYGIEII